MPAFLADAPPASTLVHADITADHVFVDGGRLVAVIDWGDTIVADPGYELDAFEFQFDAITAVRRRVDLASISTLDELAERLFGPIAS